MTRVAGILVNMVPYHHARWEAFAQHSGMETQVVEISGRDEFAILEFAAPASYHRKTLFPGVLKPSLSTPALARALGSALARLRPEVVCVSGWAMPVSLSALYWAVRNGVSVVVLSESNEFDEPRSGAKEFIKRRMVGLCSAGLVGGTPQADYLAQLGMPRGSVFLGYDAVDNEYFARNAAESRKQKAESRNKYGLPEEYFLASARFVEKKNLPRLLQAYALYREKGEERKTTGPQDYRTTGPHDHKPWDLVVLGDGPLKPAINHQLSTLNLHSHVHLPGARPYPSLPGYYGLASAFVHASTTEQWGLVVNEAMASGLPVLVSNRCGCAADLVQDGVNGFTFDPYNVEQMAELMLRISSSEVGRVTSCAPSPSPATEVGRVTPCAPSPSPLRSGRGQGEVSNPPPDPEPSALNPQPSTTLAEMGAASGKIIANWGPERFANGLKQAVERALAVGPKRASLLDRILLRALIAR